MLVHRIALQIGNTLVEREQDLVGSEGRIRNCRICRTPKSFVIDRVGIASPGSAQDVSSCASSAAQASAAWMWPRLREG